MRVPLILSLLLSACSAPVAAQTDVSVAPFRSIAVTGGGHVTLKTGPEPRVRLLQGDARTSSLTVAAGRLTIQRCRAECPKGYRLEAEVVLPEVTSLMVTDGGRIIVEDGFPAQAGLGLAVDQGGSIDARAIRAEGVVASVNSGGRILTKPMRALTASVEQGGVVTWWGKPKVTRTIHGGGVVRPGEPSEEHMTLAELTPAPVPPPPLPPLPNVGNAAPPVPPVPPVPPD